MSLGFDSFSPMTETFLMEGVLNSLLLLIDSKALPKPDVMEVWSGMMLKGEPYKPIHHCTLHYLKLRDIPLHYTTSHLITLP